jgi:hypothetical protein
MNQSARYLILAGGILVSFFVQRPPAAASKAASKVADMRAQAASTLSVASKGDEQTLEINNVTFEVTGDHVPDRPQGQRLLLRKSTRSKYVLGDEGQEATVTLEAWPLGADLRQKPLYTTKVSGVGGQTVDAALFVADRGLEEVAWWSVYRLGTGQHLFDTYVPLVSFSISREVMEMRYVGLEVPPDDAADVRLRRPEVVAVLTYASEATVKKEFLITCDNRNQAAELRSYSDTTRTVSVTEGRPPHALQIAFEANPPLHITIPLAGDDLDLAHAQLPRTLHLAAWNRWQAAP